MSQVCRRITPCSGPCGPTEICARGDSPPNTSATRSPHANFAPMRVIGSHRARKHRGIADFPMLERQFALTRRQVIHIVNRWLNEGLEARLNRLLIFPHEHCPDRDSSRQGRPTRTPWRRPTTRLGGAPIRASSRPRTREAGHPPRPRLVGQRHPQRQPHLHSRLRRQGRRLRQLRPQPRAQPVLRRRNLRALPAPGISGPRLRPPPVHRRRAATLPRAGSRASWSGRCRTTSRRWSSTARSAARRSPVPRSGSANAVSKRSPSPGTAENEFRYRS